MNFSFIIKLIDEFTKPAAEVGKAVDSVVEAVDNLEKPKPGGQGVGQKLIDAVKPAEELVDAIEKVEVALDKVAPAADDVKEAITDSKDAAEDLAGAIDKVPEAAGNAWGSMSAGKQSADDLADAIDDVDAALDKLPSSAGEASDALDNINLEEKAKGFRGFAQDFAGGFGDAIREGFSVDNIEQATKNAEAKFNQARSRLWGAVGMAFSLGVPLRNAIQLDQSMKGLEKVLDVPESRLKELRKFALETSMLVPLAAKDLIELMAEAAQGGIEESGLEQFALYASNAAIAFDMAGADIGERFAKLKNVYQLNQNGIEDLGDATNHLSNNMAAKASQLLDFTNRASGAAAILKLTAVETSAVGAAMIAAGIVPETAARGITTLATRILAGGKKIDDALSMIGMSREGFLQSLETDGADALVNLFETMSQNEKGMNALIELVGTDFADDFAKFLGNPGLLAQALRLVGDRVNYTGSALEEASKQADGAERKFALFWQRINNAGTSFGETLLPTALEIIDMLGSLAVGFGEFSGENPEFMKFFTMGVAGVMALSIAGRGLAFVFSGVRMAFIPLAALFLKFNKDGRNIAIGWRILAGVIGSVSAAIGIGAAGVGGFAGGIRDASKEAVTARTRLGALGTTINGMVRMGAIINVGFQILDDFGRTPEERLEQVRKNVEAFQKLEKKLDETKAGQIWQSVKDGFNGLFGLEPGDKPADAVQGWLKGLWEAIERKPPQMGFNGPASMPGAFNPAIDPLKGVFGGALNPTTQKIEQTISAEVIDKRPPNVSMQNTFHISGVVDPVAAGRAAAAQLGNAVASAKSGALTDGGD